MTRLLRGQRGTEHTMGNPALAGARVVVLDTTLAPLPIAEADLGLPWNWRVGPAARAVSDDSYAALGFTPTGRGLVPFAPVPEHRRDRCRRRLRLRRGLPGNRLLNCGIAAFREASGRCAARGVGRAHPFARAFADRATAAQEPQLKSATDDLRGRVRDTFGTAWWLAAQ
jgi:hypothetical protein